VARVIDISPVTRIEGHLDFRVELEDGRVSEAWATGALFRGFEIMLRGRDPLDALVFVPRICGVCPTSHQVAAVKCLEDAFGATPPPNAHLVRSILLGLENAYSHAAHFYVLFGPDLANQKYAGHPLYPELARRFSPITGSSWLTAVAAKRKLNEAYAILGGQFPHSNVFIPGGVTCRPTASDVVKVTSILMEVQDVVEQVVLGGSVERWLENRSLADVQAWLGEGDHADSDLGLFLRVGPELGLDRIGAGPGNFLAYGVYEQADGTPWLKPGFYDGEFHTFDQTHITEHVKHSWYEDYEGGKHPSEGETRPRYVRDGGKYSYAKAPRYRERPTQVGPLARQINDRDPLVLDLAAHLGVNAFTRMLARLHEEVRLLAELRNWLSQLDLREPFYRRPPAVPTRATGFGRTEAGRGALGHWIRIEDGRIANYQVITPTAWNVSPKDALGQHGPIEQAVIGTPVADESNPVEVQHVIRSFDPCLACTVHLIRARETVATVELDV
jgi:hydrogenase large subunit